MILEVRLRPEAELDLADAALWYEEQQPELGHNFLDEVLAVISMIAESPLMYPLVHRNTRRVVTRRFPFGIYYRVESTSAVIVAVMHARQQKSASLEESRVAARVSMQIGASLETRRTAHAIQLPFLG